ncbi:hypothetical protein [Nonomuraea sp. NPDC049400]|uniref:hypothetical protein n=1 Tax=Nonomuraea sp. NPDC049400 TaxID=3364352 RepID=UPI003796EC29
MRRIAMSHPSDALVVTATDAEGNGFAPVIGVEVFAHFVAGRHPSASEVAGRSRPGSRSCIVLWPSDDPRFSCDLLTAAPTPPPSTGKVQP